ncbi:MAG: TRAP transporter small permease [Pseudomonadota bacterium]
MTKRSVQESVWLAVRHPLETVICALLVGLAAVVFSQVVARYVLETPLSWSEEMARFLLMWLSMLSAAYAFKTKSHFALQILVKQMPARLQHAIRLMVHAIGAAFFAILLYYGVIFVSGVSGHLAPALQMPMEIPYSSIVAGSALILIEILKSAWREIANGPGDPNAGETASRG